MNWSLPGDPNNAVQHEYWNSDTGQRALYQNMSDYFTNNGQNFAMAGWFSRMFGPLMDRYRAAGIQDKDLTFENYLQGQSGGLSDQFTMQAPALRGSNPGMFRTTRQLW